VLSGPSDRLKKTRPARGWPCQHLHDLSGVCTCSSSVTVCSLCDTEHICIHTQQGRPCMIMLVTLMWRKSDSQPQLGQQEPAASLCCAGPRIVPHRRPCTAGHNSSPAEPGGWNAARAPIHVFKTHLAAGLCAARVRAPASTPTQVLRKSRDVVSVGLRSCASIARRSSTRNCVTQLRGARRRTRQPVIPHDALTPAHKALRTH